MIWKPRKPGLDDAFAPHFYCTVETLEREGAH